MKEQNTTLELGKCYRVKFENISWCIKIYEKRAITENLTLLSAVEVSYISANIYQQSENSKYEVQEISNSEFMHEFRTKRNEINKLIKKMS